MLLTTITGISRPLEFSGAPLRREIPRSLEPGATPEQVEATFLLSWAGDEFSGRPITAPRTQRRARFDLWLSVFLGGGEDAGSDAQQSNRLLADIWEDVVQVLEDPNNHDRTNTGWNWAGAFLAGRPVQKAGRLRVLGTFDALYELDMGAL